MRRRLMMGQGVDTIPGKHSAVAGDILCANSDGSKMVVPASDYASIPSGYEAIGIVVIPPSHDVYGTGEGAAMSLKYTETLAPDEGSMYETEVYWGQSAQDISITNFSGVNIYGTDGSIIGYDGRSHLPSDYFTGTQCATDPVASYVITGTQSPSPYLPNGSRNEEYFTTKSTEHNALSDFDGKGNTNVLCSLATAQSDWRTASKITNTFGRGYSPAACCCWRYHTTGTNQGDWYLPACGELGYLIVRLKAIKTSADNVGFYMDGESSIFWTSSEYSSSFARSISTINGLVSYETKNTAIGARCFIRF